MNKKFLIAGIIAVALIFIILIIIVVLSNHVGTQNIVITNGIISTNNTNETNTTANNVTNRVRSQKIVGEIEYQELEDGGSIPIPPTFTYVEGQIEDGAVIEDEDGNQFVWIPIKNDEEYKRFLFEFNGSLSNDDLASKLEDSDDYDLDYTDSVRNYGGFYIARFEAGKDDDTGAVVSKLGIKPWTNISWQKAKNLAYNMYDLNDAFQSDLVNSFAWDSMCLWLRDHDVNIDDSSDIGNYLNGREGLNMPVESGSNSRWEVNHIYDLAGNVWELTTETYKTIEDGNYETIHVARGGAYWNSGNEVPLSSRLLSDYDVANVTVGFRVVLYLK